LLCGAIGRGRSTSCRVDERAEVSARCRGEQVSEFVAESETLVRCCFEVIPLAREVVVIRQQEQCLDLLGDGTTTPSVRDDPRQRLPREPDAVEVGAGGGDPGDAHGIRCEPQSVDRAIELEHGVRLGSRGIGEHRVEHRKGVGKWRHHLGELRSGVGPEIGPTRVEVDEDQRLQRLHCGHIRRIKRPLRGVERGDEQALCARCVTLPVQ
jgi:hypothetical protein